MPALRIEKTTDKSPPLRVLFSFEPVSAEAYCELVAEHKGGNAVRYDSCTMYYCWVVASLYLQCRVFQCVQVYGLLLPEY